MHRSVKNASGAALWLIVFTVAASCIGCIPFAANMIRTIRGDDLPAEYNGLNEKRVAIVCTVDGKEANDASSSLLTSFISAALVQNLPKATIVSQEEVDRWAEIEGWSNNDALAIGKGVKADQVVSIQVSNLKLRDGATLYRGSSDIRVSVYDVAADGKLSFVKQFTEHSYPRIGGAPISGTTESKFRSAYLQVVGIKVANLFHAVDPTFEYALDATAAQF